MCTFPLFLLHGFSGKKEDTSGGKSQTGDDMVWTLYKTSGQRQSSSRIKVVSGTTLDNGGWTVARSSVLQNFQALTVCSAESSLHL